MIAPVSTAGSSPITVALARCPWVDAAQPATTPRRRGRYRGACRGERSEDRCVTGSPPVASACSAIDLSTRNGSSIAAVRRLREDAPATEIVVLTMDESAAFPQQAIGAGAAASALKQAADAELSQAVRNASAGQRFSSAATSPCALLPRRARRLATRWLIGRWWAGSRSAFVGVSACGVAWAGCGRESLPGGGFLGTPGVGAPGRRCGGKASLVEAFLTHPRRRSAAPVGCGGKASLVEAFSTHPVAPGGPRASAGSPRVTSDVGPVRRHPTPPRRPARSAAISSRPRMRRANRYER